MRETDWLTLFRDLVSADPLVSSDARKRTFDTILPELSSKDAVSLQEDIAAITKTLQLGDEQRVREQASGLLGTLAFQRPDGTTALQPAFPVLLSLVTDKNTIVRRNAVFAIINLKPSIPKEAVPALLKTPFDSDSDIARASILGLARLSDDSNAALSAFKDLFSSHQPKRIRLLALAAIGPVKVQSPEIIGGLKQVLGDPDRELILQTLQAIRRIGPEAAILLEQVQNLADTSSDKEIATLAAAIANRLR
jgi:HEAT repeat protein